MGLSVQQRAECVGTFRWLEIQLMEMLAQWVPTTPEMEIKVLFGRHVWDCAQHADRLGRRAFELRAPLHYTLPASDACRAWLDATAAIESTAGRLEAFYDVASAFMAGQYRGYVAATDPLMDEPTVRILEGALGDYQRMLAERRRLAGQAFEGVPDGRLSQAVRVGLSLGNVIAHSNDDRRARGVPA